jgi:CRP-like cAMP-binding protein
MYQYSIQLPGEKNIIDLHVANEWFFNQHSFATQSPSTSFIAAYTDSTVLELSIESIHYLINCSQAFFQLNKLLAQPADKNYFFDNMLTPLEKYQYIVDKRSGLLQTFPLKMIASYLKVSPETLSRVREKLTRPTNIS